jgi:hypothetical protein
MENQQIIQQVSPRGRVVGVADIVLLIDNTGSMQPCIEELKKNISQNFVDALEGRLTSAQQKVNWRARVVTYGDVEADGPNWINLSNPFVSEARALKEQIEAISLIGGGDIEETLLDAIYSVLKNTEWRQNCHRFIVIFTDAPTKPRMDARVIEENEANDVPHLQHLLISNRIKVYAVLPDHEIYRQLFGPLPKCWPVWIGKPGEQGVYEGLKNQKFDELLQQIAKTVTQSSGEPIPA